MLNNWKILTTIEDIFSAGRDLDNCLASECFYTTDAARGDYDLLVHYVDGTAMLYASILGNAIVDIGSTKSSPPHKKFFPIVLDLLNHDCEFDVWDVDNQIKAAGLAKINGTWVDVNSLPDGTEVQHSLNLNNGTNIMALPSNMVVRGDLSLCKTQITNLPDGLVVDGTVDIRYTGINPALVDHNLGLIYNTTLIELKTDNEAQL